MRSTTILISGAGIAGSALAYWLAQFGFTPTVVEQAQGTRSSGNPVDVRGAAVDVVSAMGVLPRLAGDATHVNALHVVNDAGRVIATMDLTPTRQASGARAVEVPRSLLAKILLEAAHDDAEFLFNESIATLAQGEGGVDVTFASGHRRRFDLVIGTDGLHSNVRRLAFLPEAEAVHHLGLYVATLPLDVPLQDPSTVLMYNTPGRSASLHPGTGTPIAAFIFRGAARPGLNHRDLAEHKRILLEAYHGAGWRVPDLLDLVHAADDLYFDAVSQVRLTHWSSGRVALLGDAASCVSLFGEGSSLAIIGAHTLARALAETPDHSLAFQRYEATHRAIVTSKQQRMAIASRILVPATRLGIVSRNLFLRTLSIRDRFQRATG